MMTASLCVQWKHRAIAHESADAFGAWSVRDASAPERLLHFARSLQQSVGKTGRCTKGRVFPAVREGDGRATD